MTTFPVSSSIISAPYLAYFIQEKYQLSENTTCQLLKTGINHSYLITDGKQKFVFRIYTLNWRSIIQIGEELSLLNRLHKGGIPVSYPITDAKNQYIQDIAAPEGKRYGVLFSHASGEKKLTYSTDIHYTVGEVMAKMHLLTTDQRINRINYDEYMVINAVEQIKPYINNDTEEFIFLEKVRDYISDNWPVNLRKGIVHLDIWYDNMHFDNSGNITIFDFDFCGNGFLALDLAYHIMQLHKIEKDDTQYQLKLKSFIDGYESVTKISEEEKKTIPVLGLAVFIFFLGIQCSRYENWSNVFLNEIHIKLFTNLLLKRWYNYHQLPELN